MKPLPILVADQQDTIICVLKGGNFLNTAAYAAGVTPRQLERILQDGIRNPDGPNGAFAREALIAEARAELLMVRVLLKKKRRSMSGGGQFAPVKLAARAKELEAGIRRWGGDPEEPDPQSPKSPTVPQGPGFEEGI
jgi:hypothetical protein